MYGLSINYWNARKKNKVEVITLQRSWRKTRENLPLAEFLWDKRPSPFHGLKPKEFFECPEKSNDRILARWFGLDSLLGSGNA